jgi:hypothetical protein
MSKLLKGLTYSYNRNIGWQDRTIRTILGIIAGYGVIYFHSSNFVIALVLGVIFLAQLITVFSAKCMICYFMGASTITKAERKSLTSREIPFQN